MENITRKKLIFVLIGIVIVSLYIITDYNAYSTIIKPPELSDNFEGYEILSSKEKIDEDFYLSDQAVYFVGNELTLCPFIVKFQTITNNKACFLDYNHYVFWFFGYHKHLFSTMNQNVSKG